MWKMHFTLIIIIFIFSANFIERLQADECKLRETTKMKLLNLNAYARIMAQNYKGPLLDENNVINDVPLKHSKQKYSLANGMIDALRSLLPANNYMRSFVNTNMGFLIGKLLININFRK